VAVDRQEPRGREAGEEGGRRLVRRHKGRDDVRPDAEGLGVLARRWTPAGRL
jgi:hypothetical protein